MDVRMNFDEAAPSSRRLLLQRLTEARRRGQHAASPDERMPQLAQMPIGMQTGDGIGRASGINDGKGFVFISHLGEVYPSGFLSISGGNVRKQSLADIYRNAPIFKSLRDTSKLEGKCGACEYKEICGGSRARAYAITGDPLAQEPCCIYQPKNWDPELEQKADAFRAITPAETLVVL